MNARDPSSASQTCPRCTARLPSWYTDFVSSDSDALIQQLLILDNAEIDVPIDPEKSLLSAIDAIAFTNAILCTLHDDDAPDLATISEAHKFKYWTEWLAAMHKELASLKAKGERSSLFLPAARPCSANGSSVSSMIKSVTCRSSRPT